MNLSMKYYREESYDRGGEVKYFCKLCDEEGRTLMTSTEIKMIKHIQCDHPERHLVVNTCPGDQNKLIIAEKIEGNNEIDEKKSCSNTTFSQDDTFYPCDLCSDIFLTRSHLKRHTLSHKEQEEGVQNTLTKRRIPRNFKDKIRTKHRERRIVPEFKCPICPKIYPNKDSNSHQNFKFHVLSHFYRDVIFQHLPTSVPFKCTMCNKAKRDRITLIRHFAFGHQGSLQKSVYFLPFR